MEWTEEIDAKARELWGGGHSARAIADKLGLASKNAVIGRAYRQGWNCVEEQRSSVVVVRRRRRRRAKRVALRSPSGKTAVPLGMARDRQCRYIVGESPQWLVCGEVTEDGQSFCTWHCGICFGRRRV